VFKGKKVERGFDAVIGDPPYINMLTLGKLQPEGVKSYWSDRFAVAAGAYDILILFFEQAERELRNDGLLSFIVPNKFLAAEYALRFREWVSVNCVFESIADFSRVRVWKKASVYPVIPRLKKGAAVAEHEVEVAQAVGEESTSFERLPNVPMRQLDSMPDRLWSFVTRPGATTLLRIIAESSPLEEIAEVWGSSTVAEGDTYPDLIRCGSAPAGPHARFIVSGAVHRYRTTWANDRIQFTKAFYDRPYIRLANPMPERRQAQAVTQKIIICKVALKPRGFLDLDGEYAGAYTTYVMNSTIRLHALAAIVNSRLMAWAYSLLYDALAMSGGYLRFQPPQVRRLPIANFNDTANDRLTALVDSMLSLHKALAAEAVPQRKTQIQRQIDATDRQIDQLVYELYGLTDDEIALVEEATA